MNTWSLTWRIALEAGAASLGWRFVRDLYNAVADRFR